jgi:hypothetical protein
MLKNGYDSVFSVSKNAGLIRAFPFSTSLMPAININLNMHCGVWLHIIVSISVFLNINPLKHMPLNKYYVRNQIQGKHSESVRNVYLINVNVCYKSCKTDRYCPLPVQYLKKLMHCYICELWSLPFILSLRASRLMHALFRLVCEVRNLD